MKLTGEVNLFEKHALPMPAMVDDYLCWSRMQTEAGQPLEAILMRKELERSAGNGLFFWGVGNAPAAVIRFLVQIGHAIPVVFSVMKSRPKVYDVRPANVLLWRSYVGSDKIERPLPPHVIVTSRGSTALGAKLRHFALICHSENPLALTRGIPFDPSAYRNASINEAPVGASQVTALLRRTGQPSPRTDYEANVTASLVGDCWVRLADPVEISAEHLSILAGKGCKTVDDWKAFTQQLRMTRKSSVEAPRDRLF
jgi:hypothetical protein